MKKKFYLAISICIIILAIFLRLYKFENRAPFDWDQARDYKAVSQIASGKFTLIGPVAKGEGGFLLGPLYYYLATPAFILTKGSPSSLPLTAITLDILTIAAVLLMFPRIWGRGRSLILAFIWTLSWFAIESSRISWNVSILPLWSVCFMSALLTKQKNFMNVAWVGFLAGLSWHIHASLIALSPIIVLYALISKRFPLKSLPPLILGYLIPLIPLIVFDLRHAGFNYYLITQFANASSNVGWVFQELIISVFARYGKNIVGIITGSSDLHLLVGVGFFLLSIYHALFGTKIGKLSGIITLTIVGLVLLLREAGFPEYYLGAAYIPTLIIFIDTFSLLRMRSYPLVIATIIVGWLNLSHFTLDSTPFSLHNKMGVVDTVASLNTPVAIHYDLVYGRDQGIIPLVSYRGIEQSKTSKTRIVISEKPTGELYIDGEIATIIGNYGGMRVGKHVVQ